MAESLLSNIAQGVLRKLASKALEDAIRIYRVKGEIRKLKTTVTNIKTVLLDAEGQQAKKHGQQLWLVRLQGVLYDAVDVLDELECEALRKQVINQYGGIKGKVRRFFSHSNFVILRLKISRKIMAISEALKQISTDKDQFDLSDRSSESGMQDNRSQETTEDLINELDVVGRSVDKQKIIERLMQSNKDLSVIPIVGIAGSGKTTLADLVYNDIIVKDQFDLRLWVDVPMDFDKRKIMEGIIKSATPGQSLSDFDSKHLQNFLQGTINNKKYLLVLDNVWRNDRTCWKYLMNLLSKGASGSKIIVTTRDADVASTMGNIPSHKLGDLSYEDSLTLFRKCAFDGKRGQPRPELLAIGDEIVKKSRGVPRLLKTLGSLLCNRKEEQYWEHIRDSDTWQLMKAEIDIMPGLKLSYDRLPSHLKRCFATFSLFPTGCVVASDDLTRLWMALGLIGSPEDNPAWQDEGVSNIKDLWKRSLLNLVEESELRSFFKLDEMVHSLATRVAQDDCSIVGLATTEILETVRFVTFSSTSSGGISNHDGVPPFLRHSTSRRLHAIRCSGFQSGVDNELVTREFVRTCIFKCNCLWHLDLSDGSFEELPSSICNLKQLRSLILRHNKRLKKLPNAICELQNLLQLSLHGCSELDNLPKHMKRLVSLRFLSVTTKSKSLQESGIQYLEKLQFLGIYMCPNLQVLFEGTCRLTCLREFEIGNCEGPVSLAFGDLTALQSFAIDDCRLKDTKPNFPSTLRKLVISRFQQVTELLQCLNEAAFNLDYISVYECPWLMAVPECLSSQTRLKFIRLIRCQNLRDMPQGIQTLSALEELRIEHCGELSRRCKVRRGEEWKKIAHVPRIQIDLRNVQWTDD